MKIRDIAIVVFFFLTSNLWSESHINYMPNSQKNLIANIENIEKLNIDLNKVKNKKQFLKEWFLKNYLKSAQKLSIKEIKNDIYSVVVYEISLSYDSPTSLNKKYSIIYNRKLNTSFLVPFEFNRLFRCNKELMIGGYKESREYEFYQIYALKNKTLKLVMDTSKDCDYGIKVGYYRNDECLEYISNRFTCSMSSTDQIEFIGKIKNYCKVNVDRNVNDLKPLTITNIKIIYKYSNIKSKWILHKGSNYKCW